MTMKPVLNYLIVIAWCCLATLGFAQQPQTSIAPLQDTNVRTVQGVGPGYWPTAGSGLTLNVAAGTANCFGTVVTYAGGTLSATASMTNYVYLNTASSCIPAIKTTTFTTSDILIAVVVAGSSAITSITDDRTSFGVRFATIPHDFGYPFGDTISSAPALASGSTAYFTIPYACTIVAWNATVDAGTVTFDVWKIATGSAVPTISNTIVASAFPAIASGTAIHSTTLTGWTVAVAANDIIGINLKTVATAKYAELDLQCNQTQ